MKVLLVDDEKKFATMLSKRLALRGIDIDCANTGEDALQLIEQTKYDVAIIDVKMPGIGGIELEKRLRDLAPGIKSIFVTGHGSEKDFGVGSTKAAYYLAKPLQIEKLIEILQKVTE